MKILLILVCIVFIHAVSILDQSRFCFSYPRTISLSSTLSTLGTAPISNHYTVNGDMMLTATSLPTPTKTMYAAINGSVNFAEVNVTNAMNNFDVLLYNLQDLPCNYYIDSATSTTVTFYKGVNCITPNALNGVLRIAFTDSILRFNATTETSESKWFIIKFPPSRAAEFDNATWDFIGNMDPAHDILWVHWGFNIAMRQLNVLLPTQNLYGVFIVPSFVYPVRVDNVMNNIYGGVFSVGAIQSAGNNSIISDGSPLFTECQQITYISWGNNVTLSGIIFIATEILRGTSIPNNGNHSVNVYGSYAQEFPYLSSNIYTNWYVQNQVYFPLTDSTYDQVKSQRVEIFSILGRMPCDVLDTTSTLSSIIIYPGSTCLRTGVSFNPLTEIIFDGRNETNSTFFVRSKGVTFTPTANFQFTYINGANRTRMHWTDTRSFSFGGANLNVTVEGNFYFNNMSLSRTGLTVVGSLIVKYIHLLGGGIEASTLNVYPFPDASLTGDIYGVASSSTVELTPILVNSSCTHANGTCESGLNITCPLPAVYVENQVCPEIPTVENTTTIDNTTTTIDNTTTTTNTTTEIETPRLSDVSIYIVYAVLFGTVGAGILFVVLRLMPGSNNQGYQPVTINEV